RQIACECGVLIDDGPARGQITGAAVTEPTAAEANILVFGDGEFSARIENEFAIAGGIAREFDGIGDTPLVGVQQLAGSVIDPDRQLERDGSAFWEVENFFEFAIF